MPVLTSMSAADRTSASVTRSAKWFQLFQPIGGVAAVFVSPNKSAAHSRKANDTSAAIRICESPLNRFSVATQHTRPAPTWETSSETCPCAADSHRLVHLRQPSPATPMVELLPSILSADFANLARDGAAAERGGGTVIHVDVMD